MKRLIYQTIDMISGFWLIVKSEALRGACFGRSRQTKPEDAGLMAKTSKKLF